MDSSSLKGGKVIVCGFVGIWLKLKINPASEQIVFTINRFFKTYMSILDAAFKVSP